MNCDHHSEIKKLSLEIKNHFHSIKKARVACVAMGKCNGNGGNLWKAVKIARNVVCDSIPTNLTLGGLPIATHDVPNAFASFFSEKQMQ